MHILSSRTTTTTTIQGNKLFYHSVHVSIVFFLHFVVYHNFRSLQQQRRGRYLRDQRSAFDLLQSELEAIVETLSDVVARRRLRAGRDQISLVTRAARSKRIELESVIVTAAINQQVQKSRNSPTRSPSGAAKASTSSSRSRYCI